MAMDFSQRPFIVIWEVTQACDLICLHCRACAHPQRHPRELSTAEGCRLIDEIAGMQVPVFVLTGGDPLKRSDIFDLVEYAVRRGVRTSLSPSVTPLLTFQTLAELKQRGLSRLAVSVDGSSAEIHDSFRGVAGSFDRALLAIEWARRIELPIQINTTVSRHNLADFDKLAQLVETLGIVLWSVFLLVPTGRARATALPSPEECEDVFRKLWRLSWRVPFDIKTTEAPHYRRFLLQQPAAQRQRRSPIGARVLPSLAADGIGRAPRGLNDGKGFVFVSHLGQVFPSGFLPISAGNVRRESLGRLYRDSPLFKALRDARRLKGKCGECEFREVCGGSRARAFALTNDVFAEEPLCSYQPGKARYCGARGPG